MCKKMALRSGSSTIQLSTIVPGRGEINVFADGMLVMCSEQLQMEQKVNSTLKPLTRYTESIGLCLAVHKPNTKLFTMFYW